MHWGLLGNVKYFPLCEFGFIEIRTAAYYYHWWRCGRKKLDHAVKDLTIYDTLSTQLWSCALLFSTSYGAMKRASRFGQL